MDPLLSILCITYNHEKFLSETINSFLKQQTSFKFEIIIGEDCSPDHSVNILKELEDKYPDIITFISSEVNVGMQKNYIRTYNKCKGKYIALCEGDDYWTDPLKLQKQVDFLEKNSDYSICFHNVKVYNETTQQFVPDNITHNTAPTTTLKELSLRNFIHTPSVVYRKTLNSLPLWIEDVPIGDYPILCLTALTGKIYKIEEEMAVYRVHDKGAMSGFKKNNTIQRIAFNNGMLPFYEYMYQQSGIVNFRKKIIHLLYANQSYAIRENDTVLIKKLNKRLLKEHLFHLSFIQFITTATTFFFPRILKNRYAK